MADISRWDVGRTSCKYYVLMRRVIFSCIRRGPKCNIKLLGQREIAGLLSSNKPSGVGCHFYYCGLWSLKRRNKVMIMEREICNSGTPNSMKKENEVSKATDRAKVFHNRGTYSPLASPTRILCGIKILVTVLILMQRSMSSEWLQGSGSWLTSAQTTSSECNYVATLFRIGEMACSLV
jgi:hypothetical protein